MDLLKKHDSRCRAYSGSSGQRCPNRSQRFSKYCWHHRDKTSVLVGILGLLVGGLGIAATTLFFLLQERQPNLTARCLLTENESPAIVRCEVVNKGRGEARDVYVSFNRMLPSLTQVSGKPEHGLTIQQSNTLPGPEMSRELAALRKAFSIHIPRIPAKGRIEFEVRTVDRDNLRAAEQVLVIREEMLDVLDQFGRRLESEAPEEAKDWLMPHQIAALKKSQSFYQPSVVAYENGTVPVEFMSQDELEAQAINDVLYKKYKRQFLDIYQNRSEYKAPVVRIETSAGPSTISIHPPYVSTFILVPGRFPEAPGKLDFIAHPPIPSTYDFEEEALKTKSAGADLR